jgi:hypothetical protein
MELTPDVKEIIKEAINEIRWIIEEFNPHYKRIYYSADDRGKLEIKILKPSRRVICYITVQLLSINNSLNPTTVIATTYQQDINDTDKPIIHGTTFTKTGQYGDFEWMSRQDTYKDSLFIFNDNEEDHATANPGGGNGVMRKYNKHSGLQVPKSAGIPTGKNGQGYDSLTESIKDIIQSAIDEITELIQKHKYKHIYYSSDENGLLGSGIFTVHPDVKKFITQLILKLSQAEKVL